MGQIFIYIFIGVFTSVVGFLVISYFIKNKNFINLDRKQLEANGLIEASKEEAGVIIKETQERAVKVKKRMEEEEQKGEERVSKLEQSLSHKEEQFLKKEEKINELKLKVASFKEETQGRKLDIERVEKAVREKLAIKVAKSENEIKEEIIEGIISNLKEDADKKNASILEELKETAVKRAKKILISSMQRLCSPTSVETRSVLIEVPRDEIKGKIVGKDGQNIQALEELLDVSIVFNDLPNVISVSAFNLVLRRIAEKTIQKLIQVKGNIDRELVVKKVKEAEKETDEELYEIGKKGLDKMGIKSDNKDFIRVVGRLQYRTSYGQNIMKHSMEVGWVATMLGSELGLDVEVCKVGGFLHDLGKAIDQDPNVKDAHDRLTKELMEKYGFSKEEVHAAWTHHDAIKQETPEALIVKAADAVSGGRPGARQDSLERYIERIQAIDDTINSFDGVKKSYIMSAGREIRVYVNEDRVQDKLVYELAANMASKIEENVTYPGKIKIKVIRRTKSMEIAK